MNTEITEKTRELLDACKKAGYERVAVCIADRRIPLSERIKKRSGYCGSYFYDSTPKGSIRCKLISAAPEVIERESIGNDCGQPKLWAIVRDLGLTAGMYMGGCGCGDAHDISPTFIDHLTAGYYEL